MSMNVPVYERVNPPTIVSPVRFARASTGSRVVQNQPDIDDRGFRPVRYGQAHGPTVGLGFGQSIELNVVRDRIATAAKLYVTVDNDALLQVLAPIKGQPLDATSLAPLKLQARSRAEYGQRRGKSPSKNSTKEGRIQIRYNSVSGPIVAELNVVVYPILEVKVKVQPVDVVWREGGDHTVRCRIDENQTAAIMKRVNAIFAPAGIRFKLVKTSGAALGSRQVRVHEPRYVRLWAGGNEARYQRMRTAIRNQGTVYWWSQIQVSSLGFDQNALNVYVVPNLPGSILGIAFNDWMVVKYKRKVNQTPDDTLRIYLQNQTYGFHTGVLVDDLNDTDLAAHLWAHEFGHMLGLRHYGFREENNDPRKKQLPLSEDLWAHRNLMYHLMVVHPKRLTIDGHHCKSSRARANVGYGNIGGQPRAGALLGLKHLGTVLRQSAQAFVARQCVLQGVYKPRRGRPNRGPSQPKLNVFFRSHWS